TQRDDAPLATAHARRHMIALDHGDFDAMPERGSRSAERSHRHGRMAAVNSVGPYLTCEEPTFVARFLLDPQDDTAATVANVDVFVDLPDGSSWSVTIFTLDEVRRLLSVWRETGDAANGTY